MKVLVSYQCDFSMFNDISKCCLQQWNLTRRIINFNNFVFLNLVSPATVFLDALGPLASYRPYCCLTAVLALCSSSDIISTLHLGDFAVPSDLPRFSSPESPLPVHSASCSYRFCHGLLSSSWPCSRIFTMATHSDIYLLMCWLSGSF